MLVHGVCHGTLWARAGCVVMGLKHSTAENALV
jgi:hypothetical protein